MWCQHKQVNAAANTTTYSTPAGADLSFGAPGGDHLEPVVEPVARSNSCAPSGHGLGERRDRFSFDSFEPDQWFQCHIADSCCGLGDADEPDFFHASFC